MMQKPFEKIVHELGDTEAADVAANLTLGDLAKRHGTTAERIADALTVVRMLRGETTYIGSRSPSEHAEWTYEIVQ
jgi:hypothetical protein